MFTTACPCGSIFTDSLTWHGHLTSCRAVRETLERSGPFEIRYSDLATIDAVINPTRPDRTQDEILGMLQKGGVGVHILPHRVSPSPMGFVRTDIAIYAPTWALVIVAHAGTKADRTAALKTCMKGGKEAQAALVTLLRLTPTAEGGYSAAIHAFVEG